MINIDAESPRPDLLRLEASVSQDVPASHVEVSLQVTSNSAVRSSEASRAIDEIAELLAQLRELGVDPSKAEIQSAVVAEGKGLFGRGSTARFHLVLSRVDPDKLVGVLQVATGLSHTEHLGTTWKFDMGDGLEEELLARAAAKARRGAEAAAAALGVCLAGVESCTLSIPGSEGSGDVMGAPMGEAMPVRSKSVSGSVQMATGIELTRSIRLTAIASVAFHVTRPPE